VERFYSFSALVERFTKITTYKIYNKNSMLMTTKHPNIGNIYPKIFGERNYA
jgi:hypothetical protein